MADAFTGAKFEAEITKEQGNLRDGKLTTGELKVLNDNINWIKRMKENGVKDMEKEEGKEYIRKSISNIMTYLRDKHGILNVDASSNAEKIALAQFYNNLYWSNYPAKQVTIDGVRGTQTEAKFNEALGDRAKTRIANETRAEMTSNVFDMNIYDEKSIQDAIKQKTKKIENVNMKEVTEKITQLKEMSTLSNAYLKYLEEYSAKNSGKFNSLIAQLKNKQTNFQYNVLGKIGDGKTITQRAELEIVDTQERAQKLFPDHTRLWSNDGTRFSDSYSFYNKEGKQQTVTGTKQDIVHRMIQDMHDQIASGKLKGSDLNSFFAKRLRSIDKRDDGSALRTTYTSGEAIKDITKDQIKNDLANAKGATNAVKESDTPQQKIEKSMDFIKQAMDEKNPKGFGSKLRELFAGKKTPSPAQVTAILDGYVDAGYLSMKKSNGNDSSKNRSIGHDFDTDDLAAKILEGYKSVETMGPDNLKKNFENQKKELLKMQADGLDNSHGAIQAQIDQCDVYINATQGTDTRTKLEEMAQETKRSTIMAVFESKAMEFVLETNASGMSKVEKQSTLGRYLDIEGIGNSRTSDATYNNTGEMAASIAEEIAAGVAIGVLISSGVGAVGGAALLAARLGRWGLQGVKIANMLAKSKKIATGIQKAKKFLDKADNIKDVTAVTNAVKIGTQSNKILNRGVNFANFMSSTAINTGNAALLAGSMKSALMLVKSNGGDFESAGKKFYEQLTTMDAWLNHISLGASVNIVKAMNQWMQLQALNKVANRQAFSTAKLAREKFLREELGCLAVDSTLETLMTKEGMTRDKLAMTLAMVGTLGVVTRDKVKLEIINGEPRMNGLGPTQAGILVEEIKAGKLQPQTKAYDDRVKELQQEGKQERIPKDSRQNVKDLTSQPQSNDYQSTNKNNENGADKPNKTSEFETNQKEIDDKIKELDKEYKDRPETSSGGTRNQLDVLRDRTILYEEKTLNMIKNELSGNKRLNNKEGIFAILQNFYDKRDVNRQTIGDDNLKPLQEKLHITPDGILGPETYNAIEQWVKPNTVESKIKKADTPDATPPDSSINKLYSTPNKPNAQEGTNTPKTNAEEVAGNEALQKVPEVKKAVDDLEKVITNNIHDPICKIVAESTIDKVNTNTNLTPAQKQSILKKIRNTLSSIGDFFTDAWKSVRDRFVKLFEKNGGKAEYLSNKNLNNSSYKPGNNINIVRNNGNTVTATIIDKNNPGNFVKKAFNKELNDHDAIIVKWKENGKDHYKVIDAKKPLNTGDIELNKGYEYINERILKIVNNMDKDDTFIINFKTKDNKNISFKSIYNAKTKTRQTTDGSGLRPDINNIFVSDNVISNISQLSYKIQSKTQTEQSNDYFTDRVSKFKFSKDEALANSERRNIVPDNISDNATIIQPHTKESFQKLSFLEQKRYETVVLGSISEQLDNKITSNNVDKNVQKGLTDLQKALNGLDEGQKTTLFNAIKEAHFLDGALGNLTKEQLAAKSKSLQNNLKKVFGEKDIRHRTLLGRFLIEGGWCGEQLTFTDKKEGLYDYQIRSIQKYYNDAPNQKGHDIYSYGKNEVKTLYTDGMKIHGSKEDGLKIDGSLIILAADAIESAHGQKLWQIHQRGGLAKSELISALSQYANKEDKKFLKRIGLNDNTINNIIKQKSILELINEEIDSIKKRQYPITEQQAQEIKKYKSEGNDYLSRLGIPKEIALKIAPLGKYEQIDKQIKKEYIEDTFNALNNHFIDKRKGSIKSEAETKNNTNTSDIKNPKEKFHDTSDNIDKQKDLFGNVVESQNTNPKAVKEEDVKVLIKEDANQLKLDFSTKNPNNKINTPRAKITFDEIKNNSDPNSLDLFEPNVFDNVTKQIDSATQEGKKINTNALKNILSNITERLKRTKNISIEGFKGAYKLLNSIVNHLTKPKSRMLDKMFDNETKKVAQDALNIKKEFDALYQQFETDMKDQRNIGSPDIPGRNNESPIDGNRNNIKELDTQKEQLDRTADAINQSTSNRGSPDIPGRSNESPIDGNRNNSFENNSDDTELTTLQKQLKNTQDELRRLDARYDEIEKKVDIRKDEKNLLYKQIEDKHKQQKIKEAELLANIQALKDQQKVELSNQKAEIKKNLTPGEKEIITNPDIKPLEKMKSINASRALKGAALLYLALLIAQSGQSSEPKNNADQTPEGIAKSLQERKKRIESRAKELVTEYLLDATNINNYPINMQIGKTLSDSIENNGALTDLIKAINESPNNGLSLEHIPSIKIYGMTSDLGNTSGAISSENRQLAYQRSKTAIESLLSKINSNKREAIKNKLVQKNICSTLSFDTFKKILVQKPLNKLTVNDFRGQDITEAQLEQIKKLNMNDPNVNTRFYQIFQGVRIEI